jgi:hypothetical protein
MNTYMDKHLIVWDPPWHPAMIDSTVLI